MISASVLAVYTALVLVLSVAYDIQGSPSGFGMAATVIPWTSQRRLLKLTAVYTHKTARADPPPKKGAEVAPLGRIL